MRTAGKPRQPSAAGLLRGASGLPGDMLRLQRMVGNRAVQRIVEGAAPARVAAQGGPAGPQTEAAIGRARGEGRALPEGVRGSMEAAFGSSLAAVRVHTGPQANRISRALDAEAFTVGGDIFFSRGAYAPGTPTGDRLLAHELTHVVQQGGGKSNRVQTKLSIGPAGDAYEAEAEGAAGLISRAPARAWPLAQRRVRAAALPANRIQRKLSARALAALNYANTVVPGYTTNPLVTGGDELAWLQGAQWLPTKITDQIVRVRTWLEKRTEQTDPAKEGRLKLAQAHLLKVFVSEYIVTVRRHMVKHNLQQLTDAERKAAIPRALAAVEKEKKHLQDLGLNKPGDVSPEFMAVTQNKYWAQREDPGGGLDIMMDVDRSILGQGSNVDTTPRIEWRGTRVPSANFLRKIGLKLHSIILYNGADGVRKYISSHANGDQPPKLEASQGLYTPDVDMLWEPTADRMVLETGPQVVNKFQGLEDAADEVNGLNKRYKLFTNNCNRAAYHILKSAGVRTKQPPGLYFGWGKRLTGGGGNQPDQQNAGGNQPDQQTAGTGPQGPGGGVLDLPDLPDLENLPEIEGLQWIG